MLCYRSQFHHYMFMLMIIFNISCQEFCYVRWMIFKRHQYADKVLIIVVGMIYFDHYFMVYSKMEVKQLHSRSLHLPQLGTEMGNFCIVAKLIQTQTQLKINWSPNRLKINTQYVVLNPTQTQLSVFAKILNTII